jgi:4a-hydroxytetrahydrobiopterin dehydratase
MHQLEAGRPNRLVEEAHRRMLLRGRPKSVASQAPELRECEIGITPFDCPRDNSGTDRPWSRASVPGRRRRRGVPAALPGWERRGDEIVKTFAREAFAGTVTFVNDVAATVEAAGHHPDIRGNKVTLALSSHAEGGLTDSDLQLAGRIEELDQPRRPPDFLASRRGRSTAKRPRSWWSSAGVSAAMPRAPAKTWNASQAMKAPGQLPRQDTPPGRRLDAA